jgi:hypothetical protein
MSKIKSRTALPCKLGILQRHRRGQQTPAL